MESGLPVKEAFIIAPKKREAVAIAQKEWGESIALYDAKRVKLKHKGFIQQLVKNAEVSAG